MSVEKGKKKKEEKGKTSRTVAPLLPEVPAHRGILLEFEHPENEQELNERYLKEKEEKEKRPTR